MTILMQELTNLKDTVVDLAVEKKDEFTSNLPGLYERARDHYNKLDQASKDKMHDKYQ